jgi:hypothetical protein
MTFSCDFFEDMCANKWTKTLYQGTLGKIRVICNLSLRKINSILVLVFCVEDYLLSSMINIEHEV